MPILEIIYEDNDLIVCNKPSGLPVQTKKIGAPDLENMLKNHLVQHGAKTPYIGVVHRLDQPVSGILVFAKSSSIAAKLNQQMQEDRFEKWYQAIICGILPSPSGILENYLIKDSRTNRSNVCAKSLPGAKKAVLSYEVLNTFPESSGQLIRIRLQTGRHHQIRVQMAHANAPLLGDSKYNPVPCPPGQKLALCAYHLSFTHPTTGQKMNFEIPCPWDL